MIPKIAILQAIILSLATVVVSVLYDGVAGISLFAAGISVLLPNIYLAMNLFFAKFSWTFLWIGVFFNKLIILILFYVSIKVLKEPDLLAFLIGIIIVTHVPLGYALFSFKNKKTDIGKK